MVCFTLNYFLKLENTHYVFYCSSSKMMSSLFCLVWTWTNWVLNRNLNTYQFLFEKKKYFRRQINLQDSLLNEGSILNIVHDILLHHVIRFYVIYLIPKSWQLRIMGLRISKIANPALNRTVIPSTSKKSHIISLTYSLMLSLQKRQTNHCKTKESITA